MDINEVRGNHALSINNRINNAFEHLANVIAHIENLVSYRHRKTAIFYFSGCSILTQ